MEIWGSRFDGNSWKEFLKEDLAASDRDHIRMATRTGRPLGTDDFVRQLEKQTGRSLRPRKPGPKSRLSRRPLAHKEFTKRSKFRRRSNVCQCTPREPARIGAKLWRVNYVEILHLADADRA